MTTGVATSEQATSAAQVGSFTIVDRVTVPDAPNGQILLRVVGLESSRFSGLPALASCYAAPEEDAARASSAALLEKLSALRHPALVPVLQAGLAGNIVFWVAPAGSAQPLNLPSASAPTPIVTLLQIIDAVAAGLSAAHEVGLSHGALTVDAIVSPAPGTYAVRGLGLRGRGAAQDQRDLGAVAVTLLSGRTWQEEWADGPVSIEERIARAQRLREWLSGITERVVNVVLRATETNPSDRYSSINEFAEQFAEAVRQSGEDLVHGAFEAISSRNVELARLLAGKAAQYNPGSDSLTLLNLQLGGGSPFGAMVTPPVAQPGPTASPSLTPDLTLPPMAPAGTRQNLLAPELAHGLPPEFLEMIAPQFEVPTSPKKMNPMFYLVIGGVGMVFLLLVAAMATMMLSGS